MKKAKACSFPVFLLLAGLYLSDAKVGRGHGKSCLISAEMELPECPDNTAGFPVYFPFPNDCGQYFACESDTVRCFRCPGGKIWDQKNKICNLPDKINCTILITPVEPRGETNIKISDELPRKLATQDPIDEVCPEGFNGYVRYPDDCRYYYKCKPDQLPCLSNCPPELYFNPRAGYCDYPWNVPDCLPVDPPPSSTSPRSYESEPHGLLQWISRSQYRKIFEPYTKKIYLDDPCKIVLCCEQVTFHFDVKY